MMAATIRTRTFVVGVFLAIVLAAFLVFVRAGEYQSLGPLDLKTADGIAVALWVAAPVAGGLAAYRFSNGELARAALALGLVVGLAAALFVLSAGGTGDYTCSVSLPSFPGAYPVGCLAFGALIGLGMGSGLVVSGVAVRRPVTVLPGVALAAAATWIASAAAYELFYGAVRCLRN